MQEMTTYDIIILALAILFTQLSLVMVALWFIIKRNYAFILWGIRAWWVYFKINVRLILGAKVIVKVYPAHSSIHQWTDNFYLLRMYTCSHERFFKVVSGSFNTILPEHAIQEIDGIEPKKYNP